MTKRNQKHKKLKKNKKMIEDRLCFGPSVLFCSSLYDYI